MTETADALVDAAREWQRSGWVIAERLLPEDLVAAALDELLAADRREVIGPTRRADAAVRSTRTAPDGDAPAFRSAQFDGTTLFPVADCPTLNQLFVHPNLVRFASAALGTDDLRLYQSRVWSKQGGHTDYEQPMHRDGNHALIPIVNEPSWWHLECFIYLHDVDGPGGAPRVVPSDVARASPTDRRPLGRDEASHLYDAEVAAEAPAGSVLAYRSDVWHRGVNLPPGAERHVMVAAFRPASAPWVGFDAHAPLVGSPDFVRFVEGCTPEQLALLGIPAPGHRYWSVPGVLDGMAVMYPGLDLTPWLDAAHPADGADGVEGAPDN